MELSSTNRQTLLALARQSIQTYLTSAQKLQVNLADYPPELQASLCCFVTLHSQGKLRGCIGSLQAREALVLDVIRHAHAAAFEDPRFPPLTMTEYDSLEIEISVLSPQELIDCASETELLASIQAGQHGLTLEDGHHRGTFLPSVWQQLPDKQEFLRQLKRKAALPDDYWSPSLRAYRYTTISFSEDQ